MKTTAIIILSVLLGGCVSVSFGGRAPKKAANVRLQPPPAPFAEAAAANVDQSWRNPQNGNTISYLSECHDSSGASLKTIEQDTISSLGSAVYLLNKKLTYNKRAARRARVKGVVDGVPSMADLLIFRKDGCIYILSYVGVEQYFASDLPAYEKFLKGFQAP